MKLATQLIVENLRTAIRGLPNTLPAGATDDLNAIYDVLRSAVQQAERQDVTRPVNLASVIVASVTPLTQAIANVNRPGVDLLPLNNVLASLQQVTPALLNLPAVFAAALGAGSVTSQIVNANPAGFEQAMVVRTAWPSSVVRSAALGALKMPNGLGPLKFAANSLVNLHVNGDFQFDFGYDFTTATPFLLDTSRFKATAFVGNVSPSYAATIGGVSVALGGPAAPVALQLATIGGSVPASLAATVNPTPKITDIGNIPWPDVPGRLNYDGVNGRLQSTLPVFLTGNHQGDVTVHWVFPGPGAAAAPNVTAPANLIPALQSLPFNFGVYTDGIRDWNEQLERLLRYDVLGQFPLVKEGLDISSGFMGRLENQFANAVQATIAAHGSVDSSQLRIDLFNAVRTALGPLLVDGSLQVSSSGPVEIRFRLRGADAYRAGLRLGLNGLNLEIFEPGEVPVQVNYDLQLGFGVSKTEGFYFIVEPAAPQFRLDVSAFLDPQSSVQARLFSLPIVLKTNTDAALKSLTRIDNAKLELSLLDPDRRITSDQLDPATFAQEFRTVVGAGGAALKVDAHLTANAFDPFYGDFALPGIVADLRVQQNFVAFASLLATNAIPVVRLDNIGLSLGSSVAKIIKPILDEVNSFLAPIKPVILALGQELPVVSQLSSRAGAGRRTWIDAVALYSDQDEVNEIVSAMRELIGVLRDLDKLIRRAKSLADAATAAIYFGDYAFSPTIDLRTADPKTLDPATAGVFHPRPEFIPTDDDTISQYVKDADPNIGEFLGDTLDEAGFKFPLFSHPRNGLALLFGQNVSLVEWHLPEFEAEFESEDIFLGVVPVGPIPVNVSAGFDFKIGANIGVGYDTRGLRNDNTFDMGFFVLDEGRSEPPVLGLSAGIFVDAGVGIPFVGEAGIKGQLTSHLRGYWKNDDRDDKVYLDELLANLDQGPECVFDLSGVLTAQLSFFIEYLIGSVTIPIIPEITLFDFTVGCPPLPPPELAHVSDPLGNPERDYLDVIIPEHTLILNTGPFAGLRQPGHSKDSNERVRIYEYEPGIITVTGFNHAKTYGTAANPVRAIYADVGEGKNAILVDSSVMIPTVLVGGTGDDQLRGGSGPNRIVGRGGIDVLIGGPVDDIIEAGIGRAKLYAGPGNDRLSALGGENYLDGDDGDDVLHGGTGPDIMFGGQGNDQLFGNGGLDKMFGEDGDDIIVGHGTEGVYVEGGRGDNVITGSDGPDVIWAVRANALAGDAGRNRVFARGGADLVYGGSDNFNEIHGGSGNDVIHGGHFGDWLFGDADDDKIFAGQGPDIIHAGSGRDLVYGSEGDDLIFADSGINTIYGGPGSDTIFGSSGNVRPVNWPVPMPLGFNTDFAGIGDDTIFGEAGIDFIYGGVGTAFIDGGTFNDFLFGGTGQQVIRGGTGDDTILTGDGTQQFIGDEGFDLLVQRVAADQTLTDTTLTGRGSHTHRGLERVELVNPSVTGGITFDVSGYTSPAILSGASDGQDVVAAIVDADIALVDGNLSTSQGGSFLLRNITRALIGGQTLDNTFDVSLWTGTATVTGGLGLDRIFSANDADFVLTDAILTRSTGGSFTLQRIRRATLAGGPGTNVIDASGYSGNVWLHGGSGDDTLIGGSGDDFLDGGPGVNTLNGGAGNDVLVAILSSQATLLGGPGEDLIYGSDGNDQIFAGPGRDRVYARGGDDHVEGGADDDILDGGPGHDEIWGDAGADLILGGAGHDTLYAFRPGGAGDDGAINYVYGDFGTAGNETGTGNDTIVGGTGNDQLFGEGGVNTLSGGGPGALLHNGPAVGLPPVGPSAAPPVPVPANWPPALPGLQPTLPVGREERGRWTQIAGSATGGGVSASPGGAAEPSVAVGPAGQYVAWSDRRTGTSRIYVALHTPLGWRELADSGRGNGIGAAPHDARRPSLTLDATGLPVVAWTQFVNGNSDIYVARYDAVANGGLGGWVPLGASLGASGISGTGRADQARIARTGAGLVVAWLDRSGGVDNVYVRRFENGSWVPLGPGAASGTGVSGSTTHVSDLSLATDGEKVSVAWTQSVGSGRTQIYLREYGAGAWSALGGSAGGNGLSGTAGKASAASVAYLNGTPFVAWQDDSSGRSEIYAARFDGANWVNAGDGARSAGGVSATRGSATRPQLAANGGRLHLVWLDDRRRNSTGNTLALYAKRWNGDSFVEELVGDASHRGVANMTAAPAAPHVAVDDAGHPFVVWTDTSAGREQVYLRGNTFDIGTIHYVNDDDLPHEDPRGNSIATAPGSDAHDGLSPAKPKRSLQGVLADPAHPVAPGDVILVDAGHYYDSTLLATVANGVLILGSPHEPARQHGLWRSVGTQNVVLQQLDLTSGLVTTSDANLTVRDNFVRGIGVIVRGGSNAHIAHNRGTPGLYGVTLTAAAHSAYVEHNAWNAAFGDILVTGAGTTGLVLRGNRLSGSGTGIQLSAAADGHIHGNRIEAAGVGLRLSRPFAGSINHNSISRAGIGVAYDTAALLSDNRIHDNAIGVVSTVDGFANGLGYFGATQPNHIYLNSVGVDLRQATLQNQHVFANGVGVAGIGRLIPADFEHANVIEQNGVGVDIQGPVQFNRLGRNAVAVATRSGQLLAHNFFYRNSVGADVQNDDDVRIVQNTFYTPAGDNVRVGGRSTRVEVRNNILWTEGGYNLRVDNDSTVGFFSDYNTLHSSGPGKLVYWTRDFLDILDWQEDVAQFDLHSSGRTAVNPAWSQPQFVARALDDYRIFDWTAGQRFSSPTIDSGDARSDQGRLATYHNLLVNGGFEAGLTGWIASPSGATRYTAPAPWEGTQYFFASTNPVTTLDQRVDLVAAGVLPSEIDTKSLALVFGARARSADEQRNDAGVVTLTFFDDNLVVLKTVTVKAQNVGDRWELIGERTAIPVGTRSLNYRLTAVRHSGSTNDVYLDEAFLFVLPNIVQPNLGADGHTYVEAQQNTHPHLLLRSPDLYKDWHRDVPLKIRWDSYGNTSGAPVRIDLYQDGPNGPRFLLNIASAAPDSGEYTWLAVNSGLDFGTYGLRIRVALVGNETISDRSTEPFTIPENTTTFYVNDGSTANDEYVSAAGSNRHTGRLPDRPKPYPNNILRIYAVGPTHTLFVDNGNYPALYPTVISPVADVGDDAGFVFTGPTDASRVARLSPANPLRPSPVLELHDADFTTLRHFELFGGTMGVWAHSGTTHLVAGHLNIHDNAMEGLRFDPVRDALGNRVDNGPVISDLGHTSLVRNGLSGGLGRRSGLYVDGLVDRLHHVTVTHSGDRGMELIRPGAARVEGSRIAHNGGTGVFVDNTGFPAALKAVIGHDDLSQGLGNIIDDNQQYGIQALDGVRIVGNTVSNTRGVQNFGILGSGATAPNGVEVVWNAVYDNQHGVAFAKSVQNNRVYHNLGTGILLSGQVEQNVVYSNDVGIRTVHGLKHNLVYANASQGIAIQSSLSLDFHVHIVNNTVVQATGNAVEVERATPNVHLLNNILWTQAGYNIVVDNTSQQGFTSDFNVLHTTRSGKVALWQGIDRPTLAAWQNTTFQDLNSVARDPLFVNMLGADGRLGYFSATSDGRDDDFHEQSLNSSFHGGSLAPVVGSSGRPVIAEGTWQADARRSPALDRGEPGSSFAKEPLPNGSYVNLGAYGNTAQASLSPVSYVLVTKPDGGEVWPQDRVFDITWRSHDTTHTVKIELLRKTGNGPPELALLIADAAPNNGRFAWTVPTTLTPAGDYLLRVTRNDDPVAADASDDPFAIAPPTSIYYVNDGLVNPAGDWTTAAGDNANDGLTPATPKASIGAILAAYQLKPGDIIRVDDGSYPQAVNIVVTASLSGVTIQGYHDANYPARRAVISRGNAAFGSAVFEVRNVADFTLDHLWLTGAYAAVLAPTSAGSQRLTVSNSTLYANQFAGVQILSGNHHAQLLNNTVFGIREGVANDRQSMGLQADGDDVVIVGNTLYDAENTAIQAIGARASILRNHVYSNPRGIFVGSGFSYSPELLSVVRDNRIHDNGTGVLATVNVLVAGNLVYGHSGSVNDLGIQTGDFVEARDNTVFENRVGIRGGGLIHGNRVYRNSVAGMQILVPQSFNAGFGVGATFNNTVYSNRVGIESTGNSSSSLTDYIRNNLIYDNSLYGILLSGNRQFGATHVVHNTVYQPLGDAVRVENGFGNVKLSNNILWTQQGHTISVDPTSQLGFESDFNNLYVTGTGAVGSWENRTFASLLDWTSELGFDRRSQSADPQFVNPAGADGILGHNPVVLGGPRYLDDGDPGFSLTGSWDQVDQGGGVGGDFLESTTTATKNATWTATFSAPRGVAQSYPVLAHWVRHRGLTNASYAYVVAAFDSLTSSFLAIGGGTIASLNQSTFPGGWHPLGNATFTLPNDPRYTGTVRVTVTLTGGQDIIADALDINGTIVDDGDSGFDRQGAAGTWIQGGFLRDYQRRATGGREDAASWTITGLTPGAFYEVATTWLPYASLSPRARYLIHDGVSVVRQAVVDQTLVANDFQEAGVNWKRLAIVQARGSTVTIKLSAQANHAVMADAIRIEQVYGDSALDDDFHLLPQSPAIDRADPVSYAMTELSFSGDRADQGAFGNTSQAGSSPAQLVQVLSPGGLEKLQVGQTVPIQWHSAGLTVQRPVALINAGGPTAVGPWGADTLKLLSGSLGFTPTPIPQAIDTSGVAHAAPQAVYQHYAAAPSSTSTQTGFLHYRLPVPDGAYTVRLHFVEPNASAASFPNFRRFDIQLQQDTVLADYNIVADAGAAFKATAKSFAVTAVGGDGIDLKLVSLPGQFFGVGAVISGIEVLAENPEGVALPTFDLELSSDGGKSWATLATGLPADRFGRGRYEWTIPQNQPEGREYLIRVAALDGTRPAGVSHQTFLITNAGRNYYINDKSTAGDEYTTAVGNNLNSGKSPDAPLASLQALLHAYRLGARDTVFVDAGTYDQYQNVVLRAHHAGVRIQGPVGGAALLRRGNTTVNAYGIDIQQAPNVTIDRLSLTGAYHGINIADGSQSSHVTISNSTIFGHLNRGISIGSSNNHAVIVNNTLYGVPGGTNTDDQSTGLFTQTAHDLTISGNRVFDSANENLRVTGERITLSGNEVYRSGHGIILTGSATVHGNRIYDNRLLGLQANASGVGEFIVSGNTVFGQRTAQQAGIQSRANAH